MEMLASAPWREPTVIGHQFDDTVRTLIASSQVVEGPARRDAPPVPTFVRQR
jgi:hypothetical protein